MALRFSSDVKSRNALASPPPPGATFASFVLFSSLAALLAMTYAGGEWWSLGGGFGFSSDAAWTRAVFARNLASGHQLSFTPGTPVPGVAAPAWVGLLAAGGSAAGFLLAAKVLGVLCLILTAFLVWRITLDLLGDWRFAFLAGMLVAASPRLMAGALAGTEGPLAGLAIAAVVYWQGIGWEGMRRQRVVAGVAAGVAALSRPELVLVLPLMVLDRWLVAIWHSQPGRRLVHAFTRSLPEPIIGGLVLAPYLLYNWRAGGPLWQQPELPLRPEPGLEWVLAAVQALWASNPLVLAAAALGLPAAALAAARRGARHPSFLVLLTPLLFLSAPGFIWREGNPGNAGYAATYLAPLVIVLGAAGLFLLYRALGQGAARSRRPALRVGFGMGIALVVFGLAALAWFTHTAAWFEHGFLVKKVSELNGFIGRWAADHTAPDASIASREIGAIGFFSRRRMVDLGGTLDRKGLNYLRRPGAFDSKVLAFLQEEKPSYLAIRPLEVPDLSQRIDLLASAVTCVVQNPLTGGVITWTLYETAWPPPSVRVARDRATQHQGGPRH